MTIFRLPSLLAVCVTMAVPMAVSGCTSSSSGGNSVQESQSALASSSAGKDNLRIVENLPPPENTNSGTEILVAESDVLEVDVFQVDDLDKTVRVESNGNISLPLIGPVQAAGKTIQQLETAIEARYGAKYLQNPDVTVFMKESAGQRITLDGEFLKPGIYDSNSDTTLLKATALAGGLTTLADDKKLYIFREVGARRYVANFSVSDIREGKRADPRIYGGDIVIAFRSDAKVAAQNLREALGIAVNATRIAAPL